jgi:hypothetical protein
MQPRITELFHACVKILVKVRRIIILTLKGTKRTRNNKGGLCLSLSVSRVWKMSRKLYACDMRTKKHGASSSIIKAMATPSRTLKRNSSETFKRGSFCETSRWAPGVWDFVSLYWWEEAGSLNKIFYFVFHKAPLLRCSQAVKSNGSQRKIKPMGGDYWHLNKVSCSSWSRAECVNRSVLWLLAV